MATMRAIASWFNTRRRAVGYALLGWVILIAVGAGRTPDSDEWFAIPDLAGVLPAVIGLLAVIELVLLVYLRPNRRTRPPSRSRLSLLSLVLIAIVVVVVALVIGPQQEPEEELVTGPAPVPTSLQGDTAVSEEQSGDGQSADIAALLLILVIVGALLVRSGRRPAAPASPHDEGFDEPLEDLGPAIEEAAHHLQLGLDPRMAVIAAYAGLELALTELGHGREPPETPSEHMARVLSAVPVLAAPAVRLGRLYELARYSDHAITEAHRSSAIAELTRARRTLSVFASDAS